jgi:uncharacterized protein (TIGR00299 family) protein
MVFIIDPQQSGIAGNMLVGAFVDMGVNPDKMKNIMETVANQFGQATVTLNKINKTGIQSTYCSVEIPEEENHHIHYTDLIKKFDEISKNSPYDKKIFEMAKKVFQRIAESESQIHGEPLDKIHFHEVGACDAVADVIGSVYGYYELGLDKTTVIGLPVSVGGGTIKSAHGRIPVPVPATLDILKGVTIKGGPVDTELATPTGSALYMAFCDEFQEFQPSIKPEKIAYGAGKKEFNFPNVLRIIQSKDTIEAHKIEVIETNLDHLNGEQLGYLFDKLISEGANDVLIIPVIMKKNRPGHLLKVISKTSNTEHLLNIIFNETGSLGIRVTPMTHRGIAKREFINLPVEINQKEYEVTFKIGYVNDEIISNRPEYEDIKKIALETKLPLKKVMDKATSTINQYLKQI